MTVEFNFDGLVGPTHNYAGLALGNIASQTNAGLISNPKQAAKQSLEKMRMLMELGIPQAVLPPQLRPNLDLLRDLGFTGNPENLLQQAYNYQPALLATCFSASSMWTANMATVSSSCNTGDNKTHFTPANLISNLHRAQEASFNYKLLKKFFNNDNFFVIHQPLPGDRDLSDEGDANHSILCRDYGSSGLEMFVYGQAGLKFPARQTKLASSSVMRNHKLDLNRTLLLQQNPLAIDAGVFHNDVICVINKNVILYHSQAFINFAPAKKQITEFFNSDCFFLEITPEQLSLEEAVKTYLFNSQLISLPNGDMALIAPIECQNSVRAKAVIDHIIASNNPIKIVKYVDCRQSMLNGGGPACLRLRVVLTAEQQQAMHQGIILDHDLYNKLNIWIDKHYRDKLEPKDLLDPRLVNESFVALDELTRMLNL